MNQDLVYEWLRKWARSQAIVNLFGSFGVLLAGIALLAATWGFSYMVSLFSLGPWLGYRHWFLSVAGLVVIPLLFWGNARTSREYLSEYSVTAGTASDTLVHFYLPSVGMVSNVNPLAPDTIHSGLKMITDCLYVGPRVVMYAFKLLGKSIRLRHLDVEGCAAVITLLSMTPRRMSFQDIVNGIEGLDPVQVFPQMHQIDGVLFLQSEPPGLTLSQELRETLVRFATTRA